jgi:D-aminoacyl-tRNA deacylase
LVVPVTFLVLTSNRYAEVQQVILLVHSTRDVAGVNIAESILHHYPFTKTKQTYQENPTYTAKINGKQVNFITLKEEAVNAQYLQEDFPNAKLIVFLSRHSSLSGKPTLSVHTPGNLSEAGLGGLPRTLSVAPAVAMQTALRALMRLKQEMNLNYEVSYECTHHGPSLNVPAMFIELGSSEAQWRDSTAAQAVAHSAMAAIANFSKTADSVALGIGGPHYNQKFTRMALAGEAVFSHMIPKYAISVIDSEMLSQCIQRTLEKVTLAILDWKGITSIDKPKLLSELQEVGLAFKKV